MTKTDCVSRKEEGRGVALTIAFMLPYEDSGTTLKKRRNINYSNR